MIKGYTLIEALIGVTLFAVLGVLAVDILNRSLQGSNKAEVISRIKQNGQSAMNTIDDNVRNADSVACVGDFPDSNFPGTTLVVSKDGQFTRFRMHIEQALSNKNGYIAKDNPVPETGDANKLCDSDNLQTSPVSLMDTNLTSGVSVKGGQFVLGSKPGFKDLVSIQFRLGPAFNSSKTSDSQIISVPFATSIAIR